MAENGAEGGQNISQNQDNDKATSPSEGGESNSQPPGGGMPRSNEPCLDCDCFEEEFQTEYVSFSHPQPALFVSSQWPIHPVIFITYRWVTAVLMITWVVADFLDEAYNFYSYNYAIWLIFATNWGFLINVTTATIQAVLATYYYVTVRSDNEVMSTSGMPLSLRIQWLLYNLTVSGALVVSFSYWSFHTAFQDTDFLMTEMSKLKHTLNTVYVLVDLFICATPVRILHLVYPVLLGATYTVFNALYFIFNGMGPEGKPYTYYVMDWRSPGESVLACFIGFIIAALGHLIVFMVYRIRLFIHNVTMQCCIAHGKDSDAEEMQGILNKEQTYSTLDNNGDNGQDVR